MINCILFRSNHSAGTDDGAPATDGQTVTGTGTYYSNVISGADIYLAQIHLEWTGTPTGVFTLWGSTKNAPSLADDTDWDQDLGPTFVQPAGSASKTSVQAAKAYRRYRIKYVNASGTGVIKGHANVSVI